MSENKLNDNNDIQLEKKIPSIHTLESDLASAIMDNSYGKNIIKIITDPKNSTFNRDFNEKNSAGSNSVFSKRNLVILSIVIFLISLVSIALYMLYESKNLWFNDSESGLVNSSEDSSLSGQQPVLKYNNVLNPEILKSGDFSKLEKEGVISEINKIKQLLLDNNIAPNNNIGIDSNLKIRQLFEKIKYSGDEALLRSFGENYAFGLYSREGGQFENYLLLEIGNFDLAFKSILDWERFMSTDLKEIFIGNNEILNKATTVSVATTTVATSSSTATSTATTTVAVKKTLTKSTATTSITNSSSSPVIITKKYYKNNTKVFVDRILKNYDIREYVDNESNVNIVYGFINNKFLLITSGDQSFLDIKNRLLKENISR